MVLRPASRKPEIFWFLTKGRASPGAGVMGNTVPSGEAPRHGHLLGFVPVPPRVRGRNPPAREHQPLAEIRAPRVKAGASKNTLGVATAGERRALVPQNAATWRSGTFLSGDISRGHGFLATHRSVHGLDGDEHPPAPIGAEGNFFGGEGGLAFGWG